MGGSRRLLMFPAAGLIAALLWTTFGSFSSASGQEKPGVIARAHEGAAAPNYQKPIFMLILGGDARRGNPERTRSDSIHILAMDPKTMEASILGIPRDSYISIRGHGKQRINTASYYGGVDLMVDTVEGLSQCRFDYYMMTSFEGFRGKAGSDEGGFVNQMGGITLNVPRPGLSERVPVPVEAGKNVLTGAQALSWSRNRHERPRGDFDRSLAQGTLMIAALGEARRDYAKNPGTALRNLAVLRRNLRMNISIPEALKLGLFAMRIKPSDVKNQVIDGRNATAGNASVVEITSKGRSQLVDICGDGQLGS